jgi:hypothetical protein
MYLQHFPGRHEDMLLVQCMPAVLKGTELLKSQSAEQLNFVINVLAEATQKAILNFKLQTISFRR